MVYGEKRKCVSFNLDNAEDRDAYELATRINFSQFVKQALLDELERQQTHGGDR